MFPCLFVFSEVYFSENIKWSKRHSQTKLYYTKTRNYGQCKTFTIKKEVLVSAFHHLEKLQMIYNYVFNETCERLLVVEKLRKVFKRAILRLQKMAVGRLWKQLLLHVMENRCAKNFENGQENPLT